METINLERLLDTTLREGEQTPKVYFKPEEKCKIAEMLYEILGPKGLIEIGQPYSPEYRDGVQSVVKHFKERGFDDAKLLGHCRTLEKDVDIVYECGIWGVVVLLAPSKKHLLYKLNKMPYEKALKRIADVVSYAKDEKGFDYVGYGMEDATSLSMEKAIEVGKVARNAGADVLRVPDTKGQADFDTYRNVISRIVKEVKIPVDVHTHNDRGMAVANAIAGLKAGATGVHVCVNALGERCGIADLVEVVDNLDGFYGVDTGVNLKLIPELYNYVTAASGIPIHPSHPIVGEFARTHKAGEHQKAVLNKPSTYETVNFEKYGLKTLFEFGAMQSKQLVYKMLEDHDIQDEIKSRIVEKIRDLSMIRGRELRRPEVYKIIREESGISSSYSDDGDVVDALMFIKTKPSCDEMNLIKFIRKEFLNYDIPIRISDMTGEWDLFVYARNIKDPKQLHKITDEIRKKRKDDIDYTSTSIVLDTYK